MELKRFFPYFGAKIKIARLYPTPKHPTIIEPFAGSMGYSLHYSDREIVLADKYPVIAEIWKYLTSGPSEEILKTKVDISHVNELDSGTPQALKWVIGVYMNIAAATPCKTLTAGQRRQRAHGRDVGWTLRTRNRIARQVQHIRHWRVIQGDYWDAPNIEATWFIDPPYHVAGKNYKHDCSAIDFDKLENWCRSRKGLVIVCENEGADWLPFRPLTKVRSMNAKSPDRQSGVYSKEVIWVNDTEYFPMGKYFRGWTVPEPANDSEPLRLTA
jgi:hypothetical protein